MAKTPDEIVADIDRRQNEEDLDLVPRAGRMLRDKLAEDLTGGAYVGSRLNMPSNTPVGKLSPEDTRLYNKSKGKPASGPAKFMGMKKGGKVSSASKRADGCAQRGKTKGRMV